MNNKKFLKLYYYDYYYYFKNLLINFEEMRENEKRKNKTREKERESDTYLTIRKLIQDIYY